MKKKKYYVIFYKKNISLTIIYIKDIINFFIFYIQLILIYILCFNVQNNICYDTLQILDKHTRIVIITIYCFILFNIYQI